MANEDDKGYPVSDEKSFDLERTDAHGRTLSSSNPALTNIEKLGIPNELPKLALESTEPADKPVETDTPPEKSSAKEVETPAELKEDSTDGDLSAFTQWLKGLKQPEVHESELIDPVPTVTPEKATALVGETNPVTAETNPELATEEAQTSQKKMEVPEVDAKTKKPKKKKKKKKRKKQADDGDPIILSDEVYSETLAELLESQGHHAEAIAMYEKLRLKYPEKSRFFAAKITKLHKKA